MSGCTCIHEYVCVYELELLYHIIIALLVRMCVVMGVYCCGTFKFRL